MKRLIWTLVAFALLASPVAGAANALPPKPVAASVRATALCGLGDRPETGMQGETPLADIASGRSKQPYFCGLRIISHIDPFDGGSSGFFVKSRTCIYLHGAEAKGAGLSVIDMRDPRHPAVVGFLDTPGARGASETLDVIDAGDRHLLLAGDYAGGLTPPGPAPLDIYDISDCTKPKLIRTYLWPANVHTLKATPDGMRIYAGRQFGTAGLMVLDIRAPAAPVYMGDYPLILPGGRQQRCHDVTINLAQTRLYCAGSVPTIENRKDDSAPSIWDISLVGKTDVGPQGAWPAIRFVGTSKARGQGDHHAPIAIINGKPYMVAANELRCSAFPRIFDISDETNLQPVGEFRLESNDRCLTDPAWAKANAAGTYGLHYNSVVDDAWGRVALGMFNFMGSGLRVVDLRDPARPREIAYYHPGLPTAIKTTLPGNRPRVTDSCMSHDYFVGDGQIWFACLSGFYVAELSDAVKRHLRQ
jgi:hypothetical protein